LLSRLKNLPQLNGAAAPFVTGIACPLMKAPSPH
jgi:hypothetical protein